MAIDVTSTGDRPATLSWSPAHRGAFNLLAGATLWQPVPVVRMRGPRGAPHTRQPFTAGPWHLRAVLFALAAHRGGSPEPIGGGMGLPLIFWLPSTLVGDSADHRLAAAIHRDVLMLDGDPLRTSSAIAL